MMQFNMRSNIATVVRDYRRTIQDSRQAIRQGVLNARPSTDQALLTEMRSKFSIKDRRAERMWRVGVPRNGPIRLVMTNLMRGFELHVVGGEIAARRSALLIPINTAGRRISTKKFYELVDWLRREKLTVVRKGILYVRVPTNRTTRGGVAKGTRVQKKFRTRLSGTARRPAGFDILANGSGGYSLTPIAVVKKSITMRSRFDMARIVKSRVIPIMMDSIREEMQRVR